MSRLAGLFYPDGRAIDPGQERSLLQGFSGDGETVDLFRGPAILLAVSGGSGCRVARSAAGNACVWDGRLDNWKELAAEVLGLGTHRIPDGALALAVYEKKGVDGLRDLIGDWSLAIFDAAGRKAVLASDYAGIRPLYYSVVADGFCWSSALSHLSRFTCCKELDEEYVTSFLHCGAVASHTPFRGLHPVPAHTSVEACGTRVVQRSFWSVPATEPLVRYKNESDYEERFRELFRDAVACRLNTNGSAWAELSGGLDSSSIVFMAAGLIASGSVTATQLTTVTYREPASLDERFFQAVERACGLPSIHLNIDEHPPIAVEPRAAAAPVWWQPRFEELSRRMESAGSAALLTGQLGDLVTGNWLDDSEQVGDLLRSGRIPSALREAYGWSQALRVPVYGILGRALCQSMPWGGSRDIGSESSGGDSISAERRRRGTAMPSLGPGVCPSRRKHLLAARGQLDNRVLQCPEALQKVSYTHPFSHRPLLEFMLTIPPSIVCRPGEPRRLMRRSLKGLVPGFILERRSKAPYDAAFTRALRPHGAAMLRDLSHMRLVQRDYVDPEHLRTRLERLSMGLDCNLAQLRSVILLESWLRCRELSIS